MSASERRNRLLGRLAAIGEGAVIRPPFHCGCSSNIRLGAGVFLHVNCVILETVKVSIGERTQIGPRVKTLAADHPRDPVLRASGLAFGRPVRIGRNVWIGTGSAVTRDVPAGANAFGNPAWCGADDPHPLRRNPAAAQDLSLQAS
ncbi:hypothetical protein [Microvirga massiliensis]|uniref:hypothetical protein n=1 Tax=Microvirga massiliensis TaxID=1033741 RepID=UPI0007C75E60